MSRFIQIDQADDLTSLQTLGGLPALSRDRLQQQAPDTHLVQVEQDQITAYCSLWWQQTPVYQGQKLGFIGHYAAAHSLAARSLLQQACDQLRQQGCEKAIAPIDGNTWQQYRFIENRGTEPIFFLESDHPDDYLQHFQEQGFLPFSTYCSALNDNLLQTDPRLEKVIQRLTQSGIQIRPLNLQNLEQELQSIYHLSIISFQHNLLYTPIDLATFTTQYAQIKPYLKPELVLLAEQVTQNPPQLVGFLFAIPDLLQAQRGATLDTIIIKTVAVLPGRTYAGLGSVLVGQVQAIAHQLGYRRAIHALMQDDNTSRNISDRYAQTIRRYVLLARDLL